MLTVRQTLTAVALLAVITTGCTQDSGPPPFPQEGDPAPRFTLRSADGDGVSLSDFSGREVLLYFSMGPG